MFTYWWCLCSFCHFLTIKFGLSIYMVLLVVIGLFWMCFLMKNKKKWRDHTNFREFRWWHFSRCHLCCAASRWRLHLAVESAAVIAVIVIHPHYIKHGLYQNKGKSALDLWQLYYVHNNEKGVYKQERQSHTQPVSEDKILFKLLWRWMESSIG